MVQKLFHVKSLDVSKYSNNFFRCLKILFKYSLFDKEKAAIHRKKIHKSKIWPFPNYDVKYSLCCSKIFHQLFTNYAQDEILF